jgi:Flp pilus assembly protein TadG
MQTRKRQSKRLGVVAVEAAIIFSVAMPVLLGGFQLAWSMQARSQALHLCHVVGAKVATGTESDASILTAVAPLYAAINGENLDLQADLVRVDIDSTLFYSSTISVEVPLVRPTT